MSELKARTARSIADEEEILELGADCPIEQAQVYLKSEADTVLAEKDKEIEELKRQVAFLKTTHDSCGHCNNCAEGMGQILDENLDELKVKLAEKDKEIARQNEAWNRLCKKYNKFVSLKQEFCEKFKDIELEITK